ncbi:uncharacterized protein LOC116682632, partial [Tachysurus ichikawai]
MAPLCLACHLLLCFFMFVFATVSSVTVYDRTMLMELRCTTNRLLNTQSFKPPPPLLSLIPPFLRRPVCLVPGRKRRRRRGRRGGLHVRLRTHLDSSSPRGQDQPGCDNARRSRECYRWLRLVGCNTGVPFPCPRRAETSTRGCVQGNLRPIPRVTLLPENLSTFRMALCNARSLNNKTFVLNDVISSLNLDLFFLTETWLPPGDVRAFSEILPSGYLYLNTPWQTVGFRSRHSTESALFRVHNDILGALDVKSSVVLVLLDLTAAFDTVDHAILISHLQHVVGLQGAVLNWFSSYLTNRTFIMLNNYSSSDAPLSSGVPQGSILGPTLFSLYMLPLGQLISNHDVQFHFYADDLQIYLPVILSNRSALDPLHNCLQDIKQWLSQNFLHLNEEKTECILFSPDSPSSSLNFGPLTPQFAPTVHNLGVIFDKSMHFDKQISAVVKVSFYQLRLLSKAINGLAPA